MDVLLYDAFFQKGFNAFKLSLASFPEWLWPSVSPLTEIF